MTAVPDIKLIVNPLAGAGRSAREWPHILQCLKSEDLNFDYQLTAFKGQAIEIAQAAVEKGYRTVVAVGGDGTIHEVVNGLHNAQGLDRVNVGIIDTGTGGDYIRTIGISRHIEESCLALKNPRELIVDLGAAGFMRNGVKNNRLFINFAGIGFAAEVARATTQTFKRFGGIPSYLMGLLSNLVLYENLQVSLTIDAAQSEASICTMIISIGKYCGGAMKAAPDADPADGLFDVMTVGNLSKFDLLRSLPRIYKGTHLTHPKVRVQRAREVAIVSTRKAALQADGELLGEAPCSFSIIPAALKLVI